MQSIKSTPTTPPSFTMSTRLGFNRLEVLGPLLRMSAVSEQHSPH